MINKHKEDRLKEIQYQIQMKQKLNNLFNESNSREVGDTMRHEFDLIGELDKLCYFAYIFYFLKILIFKKLIYEFINSQ